MTKEARLQYLKELELKHQEQEMLLCNGIPPTTSDVLEIVEEMEGFREELRDRQSANHTLTSDEV